MEQKISDPKTQARLGALVLWAASAASDGHPVPETAHLQLVAVAKRTESAGIVSDVVTAWATTMDWLMGQANFGVAEPHLQLPNELREPSVSQSVVSLDADTTAVRAEVVTATVDVSEAKTQTSAVSALAAKASKKSQPSDGVGPSSKMTQWETQARANVKAAIEKFSKPLHDLRSRDANEGDTRLVVTDMLCEGLGYDKFRDLTTEYMVKQDFADYGVRIDKQLVAFIEVKRISQKLNERHLRQVQMYAVNEGVEWMILTNGAVWQVYHLTGGLPVIVNLAFEIDLLGPTSIAEKTELMFLLHREALKRRRIDETWKTRAATEPGELLSVILSEAVLDQIRKEVKRRSGIAATTEQLAEIIKGEIVDPKVLARQFKP